MIVINELGSIGVLMMLVGEIEDSERGGGAR